MLKDKKPDFELVITYAKYEKIAMKMDEKPRAIHISSSQMAKKDISRSQR